METLIAIAGAVALVGLPGGMGAQWVAREIGRGDATGGTLLLIFGTVMTILIAYGAPRGQLQGLATFGIATPIVFAIFVVLGGIAGIRQRR